MGFANVKACIDRIADGATVTTGFRKAPTVVTAAGYWLDLAMSPGNPKPLYYASTPLIVQPISQANDVGIFHGGAVLPSVKHLRRITMLHNTAGAANTGLILCDYLLYYPFIDEAADVGSEQEMLGTATLPRSTTGDGVQMMGIVVAGHVGSPVTTFTVRYTNSIGQTDRVSRECKLNAGQFVNGTIVHAAPALAQCYGPWIPLQDGDRGVRSVQGVTITSGGDVGLFTLVLVKPICTLAFHDFNAPAEVDFLLDRPALPVIPDDAYLNFVAHCGGSVTGAQMLGIAEFVWS